MSARRARLLRLATRASLFTALLLIILKLGAWLVSGSVSLLASLLDSLMDAAASLFNLLAVRYALQPADEDHHFGHGKAEALAGLAQAAFITGSALLLMLQAAERLYHPQPLQQTGLGIAVMLFSMVATLALVSVQRWVIRVTGSLAVRADSLHYLTDLASNAGIILALLLVERGLPAADPIIALAVALYILHSAWHIGHSAVQALLDRALPSAEITRIRELACAHPQVEGVHDMRTRQVGAIRHIQLHLELPDQLSLREAHAIGNAVERDIRRNFPEADIIIHHDPTSLARLEKALGEGE